MDIGTLLGGGRYVVRGLLGEGGMASVHRVFDTRLEVERAIKVLAPRLAAIASLRARFEAEARTMARLSHPNVVAVHDVIDEDGLLYIVMELLAGGSLADRLAREGPLPPAAAGAVLRKVIAAVQAAHDAGVIHRDLKPENVLEGLRGEVKVGDFGIAHLGDAAQGRRLTLAGVALGTIGFMAPEQRTGEADPDGRADVFSLGALLYVLVTGARPGDLFRAELDPSVLKALPAELIPVVARATRYDRDDRYPSAAAMGEALGAALGTPEPPAAPSRPGAFTPRPALDIPASTPRAPGTLIPIRRGDLLVETTLASPKAAPPPRVTPSESGAVEDAPPTPPPGETRAAPEADAPASPPPFRLRPEPRPLRTPNAATRCGASALPERTRSLPPTRSGGPKRAGSPPTSHGRTRGMSAPRHEPAESDAVPWWQRGKIGPRTRKMRLTDVLVVGGVLAVIGLAVGVTARARVVHPEAQEAATSPAPAAARVPGGASGRAMLDPSAVASIAPITAASVVPAWSGVAEGYAPAPDPVLGPIAPEAGAVCAIGDKWTGRAAGRAFELTLQRVAGAEVSAEARIRGTGGWRTHTLTGTCESGRVTLGERSANGLRLALEYVGSTMSGVVTQAGGSASVVLDRST